MEISCRTCWHNLNGICSWIPIKKSQIVCQGRKPLGLFNYYWIYVRVQSSFGFTALRRKKQLLLSQDHVKEFHSQPYFYFVNLWIVTMKFYNCRITERKTPLTTQTVGIKQKLLSVLATPLLFWTPWKGSWIKKKPSLSTLWWFSKLQMVVSKSAVWAILKNISSDPWKHPKDLGSQRHFHFSHTTKST